MNEPKADANADSLENVKFDNEGYLTDFSQWSREIGLQIALQEKIEITDPHWKVIEFIQDCHAKSIPLSIRSMGKKGPVSIKEFYTLFPGGPLKKASRIAGIPKPVSCI